MFFFETEAESENIQKIRNDIDHFTIFVHCHKSILDLYSQVYHRFFTYDLKSKKSVSTVLKNILERHYIHAVFQVGCGDRTASSAQPETASSNQLAHYNVQRKRTVFELNRTKTKSISVKVNPAIKNSPTVYANSTEFVEAVKNILDNRLG